MYELKLDWKEFSINMNAAEAWLRANAGDQYRGNSADSCLHVWFETEPSQDIKDAVSAYWDGLHDASDEATSYKSQEDMAADRATKKSSGKAKLLALGLSEDEVSALLG